MTRAVWAAIVAAMVGTGCDAVAVPRGGEVDGQDPPSPIVSVPPAFEACPHTTDQLSFSLSSYADPSSGGPLAGGHLLACGAESGAVSFAATVTAVESGFMDLSACAEGGGSCHALRLIVEAQDLSLPLLLGAFVHVDASVHATGEGCAQSLVIQNLASLDGLPNPITTAPVLWLAGADGTLATAPDSPFHVRDVAACSASLPGYGDDALELTFEVPGGAPVALTLPMGASYITQLGPGNTNALLARNLRSFHTTNAPPGDTREFAYWIEYVTPELP